MNNLTYFYINNQKFNYSLEFQNSHINNYWKHNAPLIEYCETLGITIPHYCYHKSLSISGNCRMCLVELKNSPKPMVSCAMSAKSCLNNSEIFTDSPLVKKARENILEFLLLNHPLDCPICDQGGECDLQDQSLHFGGSKKRFYNFKRVVTDKNIGPIVKTVMTRCIHCTRCVRFSEEIAGTADLGMFGRGLDSEIGTYVSKTFQSELSGNVIDLCPVGALTSKPYPFLSRSWELKTTNSIDFSDGFGTDIQVSLKNNQIVKITPGYDSNLKHNPWISDKSRFGFDGMFSPNRVLTGFINFESDKFVSTPTWKILFKEIILTLYFQDHLSKHFLKHNNLIIIFSNNISVEVLNLLYLISKKYSFITLRKFEKSIHDVDFESNFLTSSQSKLKLELLNSNLCFLIGIFSRYEGFNFNLQLRNRYSKGNFKILSLNSSKNLTFPTHSVGVNIKNLKDIVEGNSLFCQDFINLKNPIIGIGNTNMSRKDSNGILKLLNSFKNTLTKYHNNWDNLNFITPYLNESGVNYLNNFKNISENDLKSSNGLYFLNTHPNSLNFKKLAKLKLLNYTNSTRNWPEYCFEQNTGIKSSDIYNGNNIYNYINIPNASFFESSSTFLNTEGNIKKTVKFLSTKSQTKEDWQIIRKLFNYTNNVSFLNNHQNNFVISFNNKRLSNFKNFLRFVYLTSLDLNYKTITELNHKILKKTCKTNSIFKKSKSALFSTKIKIWINDFYVGGSDPYSRYSSTMIKCSKILRIENNNFSHLV